MRLFSTWAYPLDEYKHTMKKQISWNMTELQGCENIKHTQRSPQIGYFLVSESISAL